MSAGRKFNKSGLVQVWLNNQTFINFQRGPTWFQPINAAEQVQGRSLYVGFIG